MIKKGYAVIIQNTKYNGQEHGSVISGPVVTQFFQRCGFNETELITSCTAEVMCYFYISTYHNKLSGPRTALKALNGF